MTSTRSLTLMLGTAETLAWASSYYLPAVLAEPIARELGTTPSRVFGAFSMALLFSAATGPVSGRLIDRFGGRAVLMTSNGLFAAGLALLGVAQGTTTLFMAWAVLGVAMGCGLYEAAFATVVRLYGTGSRGMITGITLLAGLASTVGWPLSSAIAAAWSWREACFVWAALHLVLGLPLNALLPRIAPRPVEGAAGERPIVSPAPSRPPRHTGWVLAYVFAIGWFISTAMAAHLPRVLVAAGAATAAAVAIGAVVGPAQVVGRIIEFVFLKRASPLISARIATLAHPLGGLCLALFGVAAAWAFAILHGFGNGILTIAIGTLPLFFYGPEGYGQRQGLLMVPARVVQASAPFVFGLAIDQWSVQALWVSAALGLSACLALLTLRADRAGAI